MTLEIQILSALSLSLSEAIMIRYLGFDSSFNLGRLFEFASTASGGGNTSDSSGIPYLSFPLMRSSADKNAAALPFTMNIANPNNTLEHQV